MSPNSAPIRRSPASSPGSRASPRTSTRRPTSAAPKAARMGRRRSAAVPPAPASLVSQVPIARQGLGEMVADVPIAVAALLARERAGQEARDIALGLEEGRELVEQHVPIVGIEVRDGGLAIAAAGVGRIEVLQVMRRNRAGGGKRCRAGGEDQDGLHVMLLSSPDGGDGRDADGLVLRLA